MRENEEVRFEILTFGENFHTYIYKHQLWSKEQVNYSMLPIFLCG